SKSQRNGPCGGSENGWCEVFPGERKCIWVLSYERYKGDASKGFPTAAIVPPCNWKLWQSSSWLNQYLDRDHSSKMNK
ncbi:MAG: methylenetetrahydrofolate reductase C-terminal domain-containing protein, partial [Pseudomonadota bacterium]